MVSPEVSSSRNTQNRSCGVFLSAVPLDLSMKWHQDAVEDIRQIIALDSQRKPMYEFEIIARLQHFWKLLCANTLSQASAPSGQDEENYRRIRRIMSYIAEHYSEKIQLEDIAELIHLSPSECSRLFKKCMNITLFGYIQEYRIERSLEYLEDSSCSITEAGLLSGFSDSNYYTKVFTKIKGCTPRQYRKKQLC